MARCMRELSVPPRPSCVRAFECARPAARARALGSRLSEQAHTLPPGAAHDNVEGSSREVSARRFARLRGREEAQRGGRGPSGGAQAMQLTIAAPRRLCACRSQLELHCPALHLCLCCCVCSARQPGARLLREHCPFDLSAPRRRAATAIYSQQVCACSTSCTRGRRSAPKRSTGTTCGRARCSSTASAAARSRPPHRRSLLHPLKTTLRAAAHRRPSPQGRPAASRP